MLLCAKLQIDAILFGFAKPYGGGYGEPLHLARQSIWLSATLSFLLWRAKLSDWPIIDCHVWFIRFILSVEQNDIEQLNIMNSGHKRRMHGGCGRSQEIATVAPT